MTPIEIAAVCIAYLLAFARLLDSARFAWAWAPAWLQPVFPAVLAALPQAAGALGIVETQLDLATAGLVAFGTLATAVRGALPQAAFAKLLTELEIHEVKESDARNALRVARGQKRKVFPHVPGAGVLLLLLLAPALVACTAAQRKAVVRSAVEVSAELLCSEVFAEKQGITVEQAKDMYCQNRELLEPFIADLLATKRAAGKASLSRAGLEPQ